MKNILKYIGFVVLAGLLLTTFNACEEENDYDYNKIVPKIVGGISGPSVVLATGAKDEVYKVLHRGGSTFTWSVTGADATVTLDPEFSSIANIRFNQSSVDKAAVVTVTETTMGGLTASATYDVSLSAFTPLTWDDFVGTWAGEDEDGPVSFEVTKGDAENSIVINTDANGVPGLFYGIYAGWGEAFQPGFGNEGNAVVDVDLATGDLTIAPQYWGQTLPGPYDYFLYGSGYYNGPVMTLTYSMNFDDTYSDDYYVYTTVFTKQ
ncbi:MAG: hypothetical protein JXR41_03015 [Bacteroidales bacterium]|nr:hypothetical protein [Bacteroidales bacterium]